MTEPTESGGGGENDAKGEEAQWGKAPGLSVSEEGLLEVGDTALAV